MLHSCGTVVAGLLGMGGLLVVFGSNTGVPLGAQEAPRQGWQPSAATLQALEQKKVTWLFREQAVPAYTLPDPLLGTDGKRVTSREAWETKRRPETLALFQKHLYGIPPAGLTVTFAITETEPKALDGKATRKHVRITAKDNVGKSFAFDAAVLIPNGAKGPVPAFLLINHRPVSSADPTRQEKKEFWPAEEIVGRGYAAAVFQAVDVDPDKDGEAARKLGVRGVWPAGGGTVDQDAWGTLAAWAWGASRVLDYLLSDPAIDGKRVGVVGHSRGGKTALWAAAQDDRFAIGVSNDSGRGGASLLRRGFGEPAARITQVFPYWFCGNFNRASKGKAEDVPVDQHQLVALIAPRAAYVASADTDLWADPKGEFLSLVHAGPVYALYGQRGPLATEMPALDTPLVRDRLGYHIRTGGHDLTAYDWARYLDFADGLEKK